VGYDESQRRLDDHEQLIDLSEETHRRVGERG
jgi:hypothetical protein